MERFPEHAESRYNLGVCLLAAPARPGGGGVPEAVVGVFSEGGADGVALFGADQQSIAADAFTEVVRRRERAATSIRMTLALGRERQAARETGRQPGWGHVLLSLGVVSWQRRTGEAAEASAPRSSLARVRPRAQWPRGGAVSVCRRVHGGRERWGGRRCSPCSPGRLRPGAVPARPEDREGGSRQHALLSFLDRSLAQRYLGKLPATDRQEPPPASRSRGHVTVPQSLAGPGEEVGIHGDGAPVV